MVRTLNFVLYQTGWFACVLGAASSRPWWGAAIAVILVIVHLCLSTNPLAQVALAALAVAVGLAVDSLLLGLGVYRFPSGTPVAWLPPLWMSVLWMQFATTFRYCLNWLSGRYVLCSLLGLFGAPVAFLGGERLGAIIFLPPRLENLLTLGAFWCLAIPLLIYASDRLHAETERPASYRGFSKKPGE